jgi:glycosyltransferase involved in cell wall biosynthesis
MVTVIMPIRNEEAYIENSLRAVLGQDYPHDRLEIFIVDGMSTDATRSTIDRILAAAAQSPVVEVLENHAKIVSKGFNLALTRAKGDIIVRVDGHTEIAPDYVRQCVIALHRTGAANVGGRMNPVANGFIGSTVALATTSPFGVGWSRFHFSTKEAWVDTVYLGAWPRQVFSSIGPLDEQFVRNEDDEFNNRLRKVLPRVGLFDEELLRDQDDEFNYRLRKRGGRILLSPLIRSSYVNRSRLLDVWRQYLGYGFWKVRVLQKHPFQMSPRQLVPPMFVSALVLASFLAIFNPIGRSAIASIVGAYTLADVVASVWSARHHGLAQTLALTLVFPVLHLSYGLGFLAGLIRFRRQWRLPSESSSERGSAGASARGAL